jgi:hypothetical protein
LCAKNFSRFIIYELLESVCETFSHTHTHTHTNGTPQSFSVRFYDAVLVEVTPPKEQGGKCKFIISDGRKNMYRKEINNLLAMRVNTKLKNIENNFSQR